MSSKSTFKYAFPNDLLQEKADMEDLIKESWFLNRSAVNPDTDQFIENLQKRLPGSEVVTSKAGEECLKWITPLNWEVRKGILKRKNGEVLVDYKNNPLHLWTHSTPFKGEISREELLRHLVSDPDRPEEILYVYRNGYQHDAREWGFSVPHNLVESLEDKTYVVDIDTTLDTNNTLKVLNCYLEGDSPETIFIMAHTCHPAQVSDGISCIAAAVQIYKWLKGLKKRKYSYRFLFGPEYFAGATYLEKAPKGDVENLKYGIFLDMLSNHEPLGFQESFQGDSLLDHVTKNVFESHTGIHLHKPYRKLWGNDETFYNGPGFKIPTIGIGRAMHREYHYDTDNLENIDMYHLVESVWILRRIVEVFESDYIPVRKYQGPLYLSRYGLYVDGTKDPEGYANLEAIQILMDGEKSCMDIAQELKIDYYYVRFFSDKLIEKDLAFKKETKMKRLFSKLES